MAVDASATRAFVGSRVGTVLGQSAGTTLGGVPTLVAAFSADLKTTTTPATGQTPTFTRATTATVLGYANTANAADGQTVLSVASGEARFQGARRTAEGVWSTQFADGTPIPDAELLGYLAEGSRTNLILQSAEFDTTWATTRASVDDQFAVTDPAGGSTADKLIEDSTPTSGHYISQSVTKAASALAYTYTIYVKAGQRTRFFVQADIGSGGTGGYVGFDVSGGQVAYGPTGLATPFTALSASISSAGVQGFYRCTFSFTTSTDTTLRINMQLDNGSGTDAISASYSGDGTSGLYLWGAQLEQAAFASTYQPTTTVAVTRNADVLTYPSAGVVNTTANTFYAEAVIADLRLTGGGGHVLDADDNLVAAENRIVLGQVAGTDPVSKRAATYIETANVAQAYISDGVTTTWGTSAVRRIACAAATNDARQYVDGVADGTPDTAVTLPTVTHIRIGGSVEGVGYETYGTVRNLRIYGSALTAAQIASLP